jgi:cellobiose transport system permease protein
MALAVTTAPAGALPRRRRRRSPGARIAYLYVLPFFAVFAAFSIYPWLDTAWLSLHKVDLSTYHDQTWAGLENYRSLLQSSFFWNAFKNTITIGVISTVPQLCMALGLAHLLNHRLRGRTFFRVAMLMPYATSLAAATVIFAEIFDPRFGLIDWALKAAHLHAIDWQNSKWPAQIAISTIVTWRWTGYNALIYLAGLQAVDTELYDAAWVDGAGKWAQFRYVTLPGLRPTILFTIVVSTIGAMQLFGEPYLYFGASSVGNPAGGGSANQGQTLGLLMYQDGFTYDHLGLASAVAWTMFVLIVIAVLVNLSLSRRRERAGR